jgi:hypothetical protein
MPYLLKEGRLEPLSPVDTMWNSSVECSTMACSGDGDPLRVEPMKATPESLLLEERPKPLK